MKIQFPLKIELESVNCTIKIDTNYFFIGSHKRPVPSKTSTWSNNLAHGNTKKTGGVNLESVSRIWVDRVRRKLYWRRLLMTIIQNGAPLLLILLKIKFQPNGFIRICRVQDPSGIGWMKTIVMQITGKVWCTVNYLLPQLLLLIELTRLSP